MRNDFYVYVHRKATDGSIFYVGKGCGERLLKRDNRNIHWHRIVNKHGFTAHIVKDEMNERCALSYEMALIASIGIKNLANMTNGGEGTSGYRLSDEKKKLMGNAVRASWTPEMREAAAQRMRGKCPKNADMPKSQETKQKISLAKKGKKMPEGFGNKVSEWMKGRKLSPDKIKAISERRKGTTLSEETKQKISNALKGDKGYWYGKVRSEEHCKRISEAKKGKGGKSVTRSDGQKFISAKSAADFMQGFGHAKANSTAIIACCKGRQSLAYGFGWKYTNE